MDPSHANWLHDGDVGKWEDSSPLNMRLLDNAIDANQVVMTLHILCGFTNQHNFEQRLNRESIRCMSCMYLAHHETESVIVVIQS